MLVLVAASIESKYERVSDHWASDSGVNETYHESMILWRIWIRWSRSQCKTMVLFPPKEIRFASKHFIMSRHKKIPKPKNARNTTESSSKFIFKKNIHKILKERKWLWQPNSKLGVGYALITSVVLDEIHSVSFTNRMLAYLFSSNYYYVFIKRNKWLKIYFLLEYLTRLRVKKTLFVAFRRSHWAVKYCLLLAHSLEMDKTSLVCEKGFRSCSGEKYIVWWVRFVLGLRNWFVFIHERTE